MNHDYRQRKEFQDYARGRQLRSRISFLRAGIGVLFLSYLASFWYYQVVRADHFQALSDSNRIRTRAVQPLRGTILDRESRVLAKNRPSFTVALDPSGLGDRAEKRDRLARLLGLDPETLEERSRRDAGHRGGAGVVVQEDVDLAQAAFIESHPERFPGVRVEVEPRRFYEDGRWAAHAIGYVGEVSPGELEGGVFPRALPGDIVGKAGLERRFDDHLFGLRGERQVVVNARGREIDAVPGGRPAVPGQGLELALDLDLQKALARGFEGKAGAGVVVDARTGEVLALGSFPDFDPNLFAGRFTREEWEALARDPRHPLQNRTLQSRFSAGSTFKVVVAAAALETGTVDPSRRIFCPGYATFYGRRYHCNFQGGHGWMNVHRALVKSCNVYFYKIGKELGIEAIATYARRLGLGRPTGIDLLHEDRGLVPDEAWSRRIRGTPWYPGETISVSIGQGPLLATPLQMASLAAALGTGSFPPLHLVRRIDGQPAPVAAARRPLSLSVATLEVLRRGLWGVVNEDGTGTRARLQGVQVAGKTGTVQVVQASAGVDSQDLPEEIRDHGWFIGYAPAADPAIAFAIFVEHGGHGGAVAAPVARGVLEVYFRKQAPPDGVQLARRGPGGEG